MESTMISTGAVPSCALGASTRDLVLRGRLRAFANAGTDRGPSGAPFTHPAPDVVHRRSGTRTS